MTPTLAGEIGKQLREWIGPDFRIEFTMRGEPTLNPDAPAVIKQLRFWLPQAQMSMFTNGTVWLKDEQLPSRLFDAGLNLLNVDCYNRTYDRFKLRAEQHVQAHPHVELSDFTQLSAYSKIRNGWRRQIINLVPDIGDPANPVKVRKVHNMAGNLTQAQEERYGMQPTPPGSVHKRCARPFRELAMYCDGTIVICCHDWNGQDVLGHVRDGIANVWYGDEHYAAMCALYDKRRERGACTTCNYSGGMRLGLLRNPHTGASYRDKPRQPARQPAAV